MGTDLEEIKNRLNVVDIIGEYLRLEKAGGNWRGLCPFHNEKSPSFMVSEEKQIWHCFGCQKGGDVFSFIMEIEGLEFREVLKILAERAGVELKSMNPKAAEKKNRTFEILELATKFYEFQLWEGPGKTKILNYLHERGLSDETIKQFRLGYAPKGWRNILEFLTKRGYEVEEIMHSGIAIKKDGAQAGSGKLQSANCYDRFRSRIMFPIADYSGRVVGYSARVAPGEDESQAKYINTPETEVYHKSRILYGIDKAKGEIKRQDFVLLVEGNMDVIAASQAGIRNVVAVSGTALTPDQVDILKRYSKNFKMFFDMDSAGESATKKSLKLCFGKDVSVNVVEIPSGKDAADLAKDDPEALKKAVSEAKDAMEYVFEKTFAKFDKNSAAGKKQIAGNILEMIAGFESEIEKSHWVKKLATELDVSESALTEMLKKANLNGRMRENGDTAQKEKIGAEPREKLEILFDELIGLMLSSKEAWEKFLDNHDSAFLSSRNKLLQLMVEKGRDVSFDFEKLSDFISRDEKLLLEKNYFQKKFRQGLNGGIEEVVINDPDKELIFLLGEIGKEIKDERIAGIRKDLKLAEDRKDREAVIFLTGKLNELLKS